MGTETASTAGRRTDVDTFPPERTGPIRCGGTVQSLRGNSIYVTGKRRAGHCREYSAWFGSACVWDEAAGRGAGGDECERVGVAGEGVAVSGACVAVGRGGADVGVAWFGFVGE